MKIRDRVVELRRVKAADLIPNEKNWRTHPKEQADALRGVLAEVGYAGAALAYETPAGLKLIDGHLRAETTPEMEIPVLVLDVTEEEADKLLATFDPLSAMAGTDDGKLQALLAGVQTESAALEEMLKGLGSPVIPTPGAGGDEFDATPQESGPTRTNVGELWVIGGKHRLLVGDCTDPANVARLMEGQTAEIILTDPPYCSGGFQEAGRVVGSIGSDAAREKKVTIARDNLTTEGLEALIERAMRHAPGVGCCYVFSDWRQFNTVRRSVESLGYQYRAMLVWDKQTPGMGGPWRHQYELVYFGTRRKEPPTGKSGDVLRCSRTGNDLHPTEKPVELLAAILENTEGETVYDPFLGSGTTLVAAHRAGRRCFGLELDPRHCDTILKRAEAESLTCERVDG